MKPSYPFVRRILIASFSTYYALFSCSALAASPAKKSAPKAQVQKVEFPKASPAAVKQYQNSLRWALPDVDLFPISVTKFSGSVGNINSTPLAPFLPIPTVPTSTIGGTTIDPFNPLSPGGNLPPLPPGGGFPTPGGGFPNPGGGFPPPTFPGGGFPQNQTTMTTAPVPAEFACPFFDNNPYESIFRALDSMKQSIASINTDCLPKTNADQVMSNSDRIKEAVNYLKFYQANPAQITTANTKDIENAVSSAMTSVNQISTNLDINNKCGGYTSSFNRTIMAFNEVINNLAPIALVAAAFNPAITPTAQGAIFATTVVSKTFTSVWDTFMNNSIDMANPDHRKAVLQNTCQFLKIAQKVRFLSYNTKEKRKDLAQSLNYKVKEYQTRYQSNTPTLLPLLKYRYNSEKMFAEIETALEQDRMNLNYHSSQIKNMKDDHERICARGHMLAKAGSILDTNSFSTLGSFGGGFGMTTTLAAFPLSLVSNLDRVTEALQQSSNSMFPSFPGSFGSPFPSTPAPFPTATPPPVPTDPNAPTPTVPTPVDPANSAGGNIDPFNPNPGIQLPATNEQAVDEAELLFQAFKKSRNRVATFASEANKGNMKAIKACSDETTLWLKRMSDLMEYTSNLANKERSEVLRELETNEEYRTWALDYEKVRSERRTISPILKVLEAIDNAESIRGELNMRLDTIRKSLFQRPWKMSQSPVEAWLNNNLRMHENTLNEFMKSVQTLQEGSYEITKSSEKTFWKKLNKQADKDIQDSTTLDSMNLQTVQIGTRTHEMACQQINNSLLKFNTSKDYLNSAEFMCNMIDGIMSDTSPQIIQICRGSKTFKEKEDQSDIGVRRNRLKRKNEIAKKFSMEEFNKNLEEKAKALQCPPPTSPLIL